MIVLDTTLRKLEIVLAGTVTANQLAFVASYQDSTVAPPATNQGLSNNTTAVTLVAAPASGVQRRLKYLSIYNADTAPAIVTVRLNDNGTLRTIVNLTLSSGSSLIYGGAGWSVVPVPPPTFLGVVEIDQPANNASTLIMHRFTDTAPTGQFLSFYTTGFGTLFSVDVSGNLSTPGAGSFNTLALSGAGTITLAPAANTSADGLILLDSTPATSGNQQYSPRLRLTGQGWKTNATAASQQVDAIIELQPVQGAANPSCALLISTQINGAGYVGQLQISPGVIYTPSVIAADGGFNVQLSGQINQIGAGGPLFVFRQSNGTFFVPTASALSDVVINIKATGHDGTNYADGSLIRSLTAEAWTTSAHGMYLDFFTTPIGSTATARAMRIQPSGGVSIGLTTDFGAGNLAVLGTISMGGKVAIYNNITTVSNGIPSEVATADLTAQVAAKTTTTLYTPAATGMFRISVALKLTTIGTSPVVGPITITYTDGDGSVAQSIVMALYSVTGTVVTTTVNNSTTTSTVNGVLVIYAKTGVAIQYAIAQSGTIGAGQWSAHLKCEAM